jgi:hypothetical protein
MYLPDEKTDMDKGSEIGAGFLRYHPSLRLLNRRDTLGSRKASSFLAVVTC